MKTLAIFVALSAAMMLSACGDKKEKVYAVDRVEAAQEAAVAKAPKPEEIIFEDHGQPTFAETAAKGGAKPADAATTDTATADKAVETAADKSAEKTDESADTASQSQASDAAKQ